MRLFWGLDPGARGALAIVDEQAELVGVWPFPKGDLVASLIAFAYQKYKPHRVALERAVTMPRDGRCGAFAYGDGFGFLRGTLVSQGVHLTLVRPQEWQKNYEHPSSEPKVRAHYWARMMWPEQTWLASSRCKKPHDGLIDAALIADWLRRVGSV